MITEFVDFIADFLRHEMCLERGLGLTLSGSPTIFKQKSVIELLTKRILLFETPCVCNF